MKEAKKYRIFQKTIKKNRTPKGDGNCNIYNKFNTIFFKIKKNRTPKGDGNLPLYLKETSQGQQMIKKNRTPKGDGNYNVYV